MKFYSFDEIKSAADCAAFARDVYGAVVKNGRCNAAWRGGDGPENVSISKDEWYDHREKKGGGIIELAAHKFNGNIQDAQAFLGEFYHLTPKAETGASPSRGQSRYDELIAEGYAEIARYEYRDASGSLVHFAVRLEHPSRDGKEFVQGHPDGKGGTRWGIKGIETILYRMDVIKASEWAAIVEGEKSADRLNAIGIPATTCCGGSKKWHDGLNAPLIGKHVAIFPDNDEPGRAHAFQVAAALHGKAASIRIVQPAPELAPKQGIDDWVDATFPESRTAADVQALIESAPEYTPPADLLSHSDSGPTKEELATAKEANKIPFRNFIPVENESTGRGGKKRMEITQEARTHNAMLDDLFKRFLGFPRKQGDEYLFDHDRDTGEIIPIRDSDRLVAWIGRRSKKVVSWARGDSMATQRQFMASVIACCHRYESISLIPSYPRRTDVYYAHDALPEPDPSHSRFNTLLSFFCPSTDYDRHLLAAFICAPLWYIPGIPRPAWIIDSKDGQGCGKTTLVEVIAQLYGHAPICTSKQELSTNLQQVVKRCVSHSGRGARVFLVDNVTGDFHSEELSFLITSKDITGMAPYGHGEETRPNDLTYVITCNTATVSTDIADRSMYIMVSRPDQTQNRASWKGKVLSYIDAHRLEIVSDIISMLKAHTPYAIAPGTRFPEFEEAILQPCCGSPEATRAVLAHITEARAESNVEEDQARAIKDVFETQLSRLGLDGQPCFIRTEVANSWGRAAVRDSADTIGKAPPIQLIRNLAKIGMLPKVDPHMKRWPTSSVAKDRISGVSWGLPIESKSAYIITRGMNEEIKHELRWQTGQTEQAGQAVAKNLFD